MLKTDNRIYEFKEDEGEWDGARDLQVDAIKFQMNTFRIYWAIDTELQLIRFEYDTQVPIIMDLND